jgi:hypothetical protein
MRYKLKTLSLTLAGTAEPLSATSLQAISPLVQSHSGNADPVFVGESAVADGDNGAELAPGAALSLDTSAINQPKGKIDLSEVFVIGTAGEKLVVLYFEEAL